MQVKPRLVRCKVDLGPDGSANTTVDVARQLSPTALGIRMRLDDARWGAQNGLVQEVVMEVVDGRFVATGAATPRNQKYGD